MANKEYPFCTIQQRDLLKEKPTVLPSLTDILFLKDMLLLSRTGMLPMCLVLPRKKENPAGV